MVSVTLHHGDCLEYMRGMATGSVDAVVTDPPYGIGYKQGRDGIRHKVASEKSGAKWTKRHVGICIIGDDKPFDPSPFLDFGVVVLFGANNFADKLPSSRGWIFWDKKPGLGSNDFGDGELIWTNQNKVVRGFRHRWAGVIRDSENGERTWHPTQKPLALMKWIIVNYTKPGDTVFDPFMGSGTTGVACVQTGRNFIGCEISEEYFKIAQRRIAEAQAQPSLFEAAVITE